MLLLWSLQFCYKKNLNSLKLKYKHVISNHKNSLLPCDKTHCSRKKFESQNIRSLLWRSCQFWPIWIQLFLSMDFRIMYIDIIELQAEFPQVNTNFKLKSSKLIKKVDTRGLWIGAVVNNKIQSNEICIM